MALLTQWTWVWVTSGSCWGQGGLVRCGPWGRRVRHDWVTALNWLSCKLTLVPKACVCSIPDIPRWRAMFRVILTAKYSGKMFSGILYMSSVGFTSLTTFSLDDLLNTRGVAWSQLFSTRSEFLLLFIGSQEVTFWWTNVCNSNGFGSSRLCNKM